MKQLQWKMDSLIGPLYLVANDHALEFVLWKKLSIPMAKSLEDSNILKIAVSEIEAYLKGELKKFTVPLDPKGTEFQKKVWKQLSLIPYGKTCSYKDIAIKLKDKNASRAVGTANGKNPLSLIVPCHRVIASDGTLGGYAGGLDIKSKLLSLEKEIMP